MNFYVNKKRFSSTHLTATKMIVITKREYKPFSLNQPHEQLFICQSLKKTIDPCRSDNLNGKIVKLKHTFTIQK